MDRGIGNTILTLTTVLKIFELSLHPKLTLLSKKHKKF